MSNPIEIVRDHEALLVKFARPDIRNPLSSEVLSELETIVGAITNDTNVRRLIFTGSGDVFASGANLNEIGELTPGAAEEFGRRGQALMGNIARLSVVTVAAINGYGLGGALDLALACRKRIAAPGATFCHPGAGLGIITGWGGTQRLPRLIGQPLALEMFFTALPIPAQRAIEIGLVDAVVRDPVAASRDISLG